MSPECKLKLLANRDQSYNHNHNHNHNNNNGITQAAFPQSGSSSTWGTNGFTSLSKDGVAKEDHLNIQSQGQAGNQNPVPSSQQSEILSTELTSHTY